MLLDPQYDDIRVRQYWDPKVPIPRPIPLTIFTVIATDTTDSHCRILRINNVEMRNIVHTYV